jgi:amino acid transporter
VSGDDAPPLRETSRGGTVATSGGAEPEKLGKGNLRLLDVVAQAVGFIGPVFSATFFIPTIAGFSVTGKGAGIVTPVSIVLAAVGMLGVAWIISRYAKRIHAAGSLYDYVTDGFGRQAGFVAGWIYYGGMLALTLAIGLAFGGFLSITLKGNHDIDISWWVLAILFWIVATAIAFFGVQISTRAQLTLALLSMLVIGGFAIYVIAKGGTNGNSIDAFNPAKGTATGIFYGMLYAVIMFIGFETAANLAEETPEPRRTIPRAVFWAVVLAAVFYVVVAYAQLAGFGFDMAAFTDPKNFPPLYGIASTPPLGSSNFGELVQWIVVIDIAAVGLGTATGASRGLFALARDGRLPRILSHVQPRYRTPDVASIALGVASIVVVLVVKATDGLVLTSPETDPGVWFGFFQWGATFGGFCLVLVYLAISLSGFRGQPGESPVGLAIAGVVGAVVSVCALYGVVKGAPPLYALNKIWWEAAIWAATGIVLMLIFTSRGAFRRDTAAAALSE